MSDRSSACPDGDVVALTAQFGVDFEGFSLDVELAIEAGRTIAVVGSKGAGS